MKSIYLPRSKNNHLPFCILWRFIVIFHFTPHDHVILAAQWFLLGNLFPFKKLLPIFLDLKSLPTIKHYYSILSLCQGLLAKMDTEVLFNCSKRSIKLNARSNIGRTLYFSLLVTMDIRMLLRNGFDFLSGRPFW